MNTQKIFLKSIVSLMLAFLISLPLEGYSGGLKRGPKYRSTSLYDLESKGFGRDNRPRTDFDLILRAAGLSSISSHSENLTDYAFYALTTQEDWGNRTLTRQGFPISWSFQNYSHLENSPEFNEIKRRPINFLISTHSRPTFESKINNTSQRNEIFPNEEYERLNFGFLNATYSGPIFESNFNNNIPQPNEISPNELKSKSAREINSLFDEKPSDNNVGLVLRNLKVGFNFGNESIGNTGRGFDFDDRGGLSKAKSSAGIQILLDELKAISEKKYPFLFEKPVYPSDYTL